MRLKFGREFYIPKGAVEEKRGSAAVWVSEGEGRVYAVGFYGKADKPAFNYSFRDEAARAKYVAEFFDRCAMVDASRAERKAVRKAFVHSLKVGDILNTSWGYDQTNVEFFEVVRLIGKSMVGIRELEQIVEETGYLSGRCKPGVGRYCGEELKKRVLEGNCLDIHGGFGYARPCNKEESHYWSAYA